MTHNINNILSAVNGLDGLARSSHFAVRITPPSGITDDISRQLVFLCEQTTIPGSGVGTDEVRHKGYGLVEQRPTSQLFDDINCTFLCDASGKVQEFFNDWSNMIFNFNHEQSTGQAGGVDAETFNYPDNYIAPGFEIIQYKTDGFQTIIHSLDRAYPKTVGSMSVGWDMSDTILKLPVSFTYRSRVMNNSATLPTNINPATHSLYTNNGYPDSILTNPNGLAQDIFKSTY